MKKCLNWLCLLMALMLCWPAFALGEETAPAMKEYGNEVFSLPYPEELTLMEGPDYIIMRKDGSLLFAVNWFDWEAAVNIHDLQDVGFMNYIISGLTPPPEDFVDEGYVTLGQTEYAAGSGHALGDVFRCWLGCAGRYIICTLAYGEDGIAAAEEILPLLLPAYLRQNKVYGDEDYLIYTCDDFSVPYLKTWTVEDGLAKDLRFRAEDGHLFQINWMRFPMEMGMTVEELFADGALEALKASSDPDIVYTNEGEVVSIGGDNYVYLTMKQRDTKIHQYIILREPYLLVYTAYSDECNAHAEYIISHLVLNE